MQDIITFLRIKIEYKERIQARPKTLTRSEPLPYRAHKDMLLNKCVSIVTDLPT